MTYTPATLTGKFEKLDQTPAVGNVKIIPNSAVIVDQAGNLVLEGPLTVPLDEDGAFTVDLPPTDDPALEPATGRQYTISVRLHHSNRVPTLQGIELDGGATTDYADLVSGVETAATISTWLTESEYDALVASVAGKETPTGAQSKADAAQAAAISAAATDATTKANAAQSAATSAAATDATSKVGAETTRATTAETALQNGTNSTFETRLSATYAALPEVAATVTTPGAAVVNKHNPVNATSGAKSLSLPTGQPEGTQVSVEKTDSSANVVSVTGNIRGVSSSTLTLPWQNESIVLRADAAGSWWPFAGHKTKATLDAAYAPRMASVTALEAAGPVYILHSGVNLLAPDGTLEWAESALSYSFGSLDVDVRSFAGCTTDLAALHDPTVDVATTASGNAADHTPMSLRNLTADSSSWYGQGWGDTHLPTFVDLATRYGNKAVMWVEIKDSGTSVTPPGAVLLSLIQKFKLEKSIVVCSQLYTDLAPFAAAGIECCFVASEVTIVGKSPAQMLTDGIRWLHLKGASWVNDPTTGVSGAADSVFTTFISGGVNVLPWTLGRQEEVTHYMGLGCKGAYITSPYAAGDATRYRRTTDPLVSNRQYAAPFLSSVNGSSGAVKDDTYSTDYRGSFGNGRHKLTVVGGAGSQYYLQAWACPVVNAAGSYTIAADFIIDTPHTDPTKLPISVVVCALDDTPFRSQNSDRAYKIFVRQNGQIQAFEYTGTGNVSQGSFTGTAMLNTPPLLSAGLVAGTPITALPVTGASVTAAIPAGTKLYLPTTGGAGGKGQTAVVSSLVSSGATSIPINSITPTTAVASGAACPQLIPVTVAVTPTTIVFTRTDTGDSLTITDSSSRGGFFYFGKENGGSGNLITSYQNVSVT